MWRTFIFDKISYILKINKDNKYKIYLTDLKNVWHAELTKQEICDRCKVNITYIHKIHLFIKFLFQVLNPLIETDDETYLSTAISLLTDSNCDVTYNVIKSDTIQLECKSKMDEIYFKFYVEFHNSNLLTVI